MCGIILFDTAKCVVCSLCNPSPLIPWVYSYSCRERHVLPYKPLRKSVESATTTTTKTTTTDSRHRHPRHLAARVGVLCFTFLRCRDRSSDPTWSSSGPSYVLRVAWALFSPSFFLMFTPLSSHTTRKSSLEQRLYS